MLPTRWLRVTPGSTGGSTTCEQDPGVDRVATASGVVSTCVPFIYVKCLLNYTAMSSQAPARLDLTAPVNYRVVRAILTSKQPFLQSEIARSSEAHPPQVSTLVRWLESHQHVVRRESDGRYEVAQPSTLVLAMFPYQRVMSRSLLGTVKVRSTMEEVSRLLTQEGATLCLESALTVHSGFFRPDRVAVYHPAPEKLLAKLSPNEGGLLPISVYRADIPLEGDVEEPDKVSPFRRTGPFRTLVDLVCDDRAYAAKDLFSTLWGVRFA